MSGNYPGAAAVATSETQQSTSDRVRTVAVVGLPNAGKSTLFNRLTGLRQKVANYPGVTVEKRVGQARLSGSVAVELVDLPGIYSLQPMSEDERVAHDVLTGRMPGISPPDAIVLILDSTNLGRHLSFAAPILSLGVPTLVVLNMADDLRRRGGNLELDKLAERLGAPVALISARTGEGVPAVEEFLEGALAVPNPSELPIIQDVPRCREWSARMGTAADYTAPAPPLWTRRLDALFLHPLAGPLIFGILVVAVFQTVFTVAVPLMDGVDAAVSASGSWLNAFLPDSWFRSLLIEGVWGGVGSVVVFLPQILLLFIFIGVLEDSGYMARAALIADRTMRNVGLQGKSFIPLLSAYACAVPAIMATRTIESKRDRIATILIAPFMTCSARLPVYTLVIAAFIPEQPLLGGLLGTRAVTMLGLYLLGFLAAVFTAWILKSSVLRSGHSSFVLELPPYRLPGLQSLGLRLFDRARIFLRRAGTVIMATSIILWILASLPLQDGKAPPIAESVVGIVGRTIEPVIEPLGFNWRIGVGLITSLAAREVIVGTLGTLYGMEADEGSRDLQEALKSELDLGGAVALLVFFAFAMQCMSTLAVVRRETGGWKWPVIQFSYMTLLAYVAAFFANTLIGP
jgi:ferrous iron transport protein B